MTDELNLTEVSWGVGHRIRMIEIQGIQYVPVNDIASALSLSRRNLHSRLDRSPEIFSINELDIPLRGNGGNQVTRCLDKTGTIHLLSKLRIFKTKCLPVLPPLFKQSNTQPCEKDDNSTRKRYQRYQKNKEHDHNYNLKIRAKRKKYNKEYKLKNPEKLRIKDKEYHRSPNGRISAKNQKYLRKMRKKGYKITLEQWNKVLHNQHSQCNICKKKFNSKRPPTMDHIIPLSKGGIHSFENIQALCRKCNGEKLTKIDRGYIHTWINFKEPSEVTI